MTNLSKLKYESLHVNSDFIGIVLCGGESKRMNSDKALLEYEDEAQWKTVSKMLQPFCKKIVISINENQWENWAKNEDHHFIIDDEKYKNHGPLSGILSVIDKFPEKGFIILGTDFPLVKIEHLIKLNQERSSSFDAVCFEKDGFLQPLVSIIEKSSILKLKDFFSNGNDSLRHFLGEIKTKVIPVNSEEFLKNINTDQAFLALKKYNG
ncbi:molybdenum cofactor guanylyltransferase [Halpernia sp. GG3]